MPLIRARLYNVFEMWIICSEKEAKWKLNNPDLSEFGKNQNSTIEERNIHNWNGIFSSFELYMQWSEYGLINNRKVGKQFFCLKDIETGARLGKQSQGQPPLIQENKKA